MKILQFIGGLAIAGSLTAVGFYAFNEPFRTDVNKNVFHIEQTVEDETTDENDQTQDEVTDGDETTGEDEVTGGDETTGDEVQTLCFSLKI